MPVPAWNGPLLWRLLALVSDFYENPLKDKRGYTISMVLTFSAWLERYMYELRQALHYSHPGHYR